MAEFIAIVLSMGLLTAFGMASVLLGADSRSTYADDHTR
jgi:hypothetical protein